MRLYQLSAIHREWFENNLPYKIEYWRNFDFDILKNNIIVRKRAGRGANTGINDIWIGADTETSKKTRSAENHVCAWTISLRAYGHNIITLYGTRPSEMVECFKKMHESMQGEETIIYFHNLAYDWMFIRKFMFVAFGLPDQQLNTKSHYPIYIKWENGIVLKDSLILAQRSLDKWANDMNVEHQKAKGKWNYNKLRNQGESFTSDELEYIEHDTLALVECLDATKTTLNKQIYSMPYTATGIPRNEVREIGSKHQAKDRYNKCVMDFEQYQMAEKVYHGGYCHANRHLIDYTINDTVQCYDFSSSYPFCLIAFKYPIEKFMDVPDLTINDILDMSDDYATMFTLILVKPSLKNDDIVMPALQFSKCEESINVIADNGRIICADYIEINITEQDLFVINEQYDWAEAYCVDCKCAAKDYLPRWLTDYIYKLYEDKCKLKKGDPVLYQIQKAKLNSIYGMHVQKNVRQSLEEQYLTGEYTISDDDPEELYNKYINKRNNVLPYQWGVWCTAYAFRNLFELGKCCETWVYSDTDSCYGINWDEYKLIWYNNDCKNRLLLNGYEPVIFDGREYWLGIAEFDGEYSQFRVMGAKRYCGRSVNDGQLHITVAGVPKTGAKCLKDNIENFTKDFVFDGKTTGKLTHTYIYTDEIYEDDQGNETGDSIDLTACDYLLDSVYAVNWDDLFTEEIEVQVYG